MPSNLFGDGWVFFCLHGIPTPLSLDTFDLTEWGHAKCRIELFRVMQLMPKTLNDQTDQTIRGSIRKKGPI
jgi:hypothetical protein